MSDEAVYHHAPKTDEPSETTTAVKVEPEAVEKSDRGLFDFTGKKEEEKKCEDAAAISSEFEHKVHVSEEPKSEEKKESLLEKLHRSDSSSSSSSDEEGEDGEKKKKKKKSLKEKVKEKIEDFKEKKEEEKIEKHDADTSVPIEKCEEVAVPPPSGEDAHSTPTPPSEEKKGFMEKIKEKLPGHKKSEEEHVSVSAPPPEPVVVAHDEEGEHKEKKGIFEKIKEKIPGYHSKNEEEKEKEKVKECD